jgi:hypothetical protein
LERLKADINNRTGYEEAPEIIFAVLARPVYSQRPSIHKPRLQE